MKSGTREYLIIGLGLTACALVFLLDLALPLGVGIGFAYLALVAVIAWFGTRRATMILAALATALLVIGFFLSPPGVLRWIGVVNRSAGLVLIWCAAFLISSRRQLHVQTVQQAQALAAANQQLELQAEQLTAANGLLQEQAAQLADANALLQEQAEELQVQAEELQVQNETLVTVTETLEQRVRERTAALRRANESLQDMSARLTAVQENERRAISRELHDESGQLLTTLSIRLGLLRDLWEQGRSPLAAIDELKGLANQLAEALHRLAVNLRPASLDRAGIVPALQQYVEAYRDAYKLPVYLAVDDLDRDRLPPELESSLYRIIQEALTNVARHARASHVSVMLKERPDAVVAVIEDDGVGFDVAAVARGGRLGLAGMHERAELRGGSLTIESQPGAGTTVLVEIPCPQPAAVPATAAPPAA